MTSPNILLTRIDNRLVHGQVGVTWTSTIGANLLVVVDDVVANDDIPHIAVIHQYMREMMAGGGKMILGSDSHTRYGALGTMAVGEGGGELVKQLLNDTWDIEQKLMGITAETYGFGIRFFTIEKTINVIGKAAPHQKIFLICRTPQTVRKLVEGGIDLKDVNVGNMHFSEGKKQISSKVYVDDQDLTDLRFIKQRGVNVFIQDVPGDQKEQIPD